LPPMPSLDRAAAVLLVIDVQEKLMPVIDDHPFIETNIDRLVRGTHLLGVPAMLTEQYVKGLGPTVPAIRRAFEETSGYTPIEKSCFSGYRCGPFNERLRALGRKQVLVAGIETHVCVFQTVRDLLENGFDVTLLADAVSSRTPRNRDIATRRMVAEGARLSSTEMALFDLLAVSGTDDFRAIAKLVK